MNADVYRMISDSAWTLVLWWAFWRIVGYVAGEATARVAADWKNVDRLREQTKIGIGVEHTYGTTPGADVLAAMKDAFREELGKQLRERVFGRAQKLETVVAVMPEGGEIYAVLEIGSPYVVVTRPDGTRVVLDRTEEAVPYNDGLAVVFRVGV